MRKDISLNAARSLYNRGVTIVVWGEVDGEPVSMEINPYLDGHWTTAVNGFKFVKKPDRDKKFKYTER